MRRHRIGQDDDAQLPVGFVPDDERIVTVEDSAELSLQQPHVVRLETRPPNLEGKGEVTQRELVRNCLRMRPDRIIVGEVRGAEVFDMLQAMSTGHDGSIATIHANSPRECVGRLEMMMMLGGFSIPQRAMRQQIASAVNMIVHVSRLSDGTRKVMKISEISGMEGEIVMMQDLFEFVRTETAADGMVVWGISATGIRSAYAHQVEAAGFKLSIGRPVGEAMGAVKNDGPTDRQRDLRTCNRCFRAREQRRGGDKPHSGIARGGDQARRRSGGAGAARPKSRKRQQERFLLMSMIYRLHLLNRLEQSMWQAGLYIGWPTAADHRAGLRGRLWDRQIFLGRPTVAFGSACGVGDDAAILYSFQAQTADERVQLQLPSALDLIKSSLEAGHSLLRGLQVLVQEFADPLGGEFAPCWSKAARNAVDARARGAAQADARGRSAAAGSGDQGAERSGQQSRADYR